MANLHSYELTVLFLIGIAVLCLCAFTGQLQFVKADSSNINITNIKTLDNNNQDSFFFGRGIDNIEFNVTISNTAAYPVKGSIIISVTDVNQVPLQTIIYPGFSVNAGNSNAAQILSSTIPNNAYVGLAKASIGFVNPTTWIELCPSQSTNFYIHPYSRIVVTPSNTSITAGETINLSATGYDVNGNSADVTSWVSWRINPEALGSWMGNSYSAAKAGLWNVAASLGRLSGTSMLTVDHALAAGITVSPQNPEVIAGENQSFGGLANDPFGNTWDVTNSSIFTIDSGAHGSWLGNSCTPTISGTWTVTAQYLGMSSQTSLVVTHSSPVKIAIKPENAWVTVGGNLTFNTPAYDVYGNGWDVSSLVRWSTNNASVNMWTGSDCVFGTMGNWTITATYSGLQGIVQISVYYPSDVNHDCRVNFNDLKNFQTAYIQFSQSGAYNITCDLNHDGVINFRDLELFVSDYTKNA